MGIEDQLIATSGKSKIGLLLSRGIKFSYMIRDPTVRIAPSIGRYLSCIRRRTTVSSSEAPDLRLIVSVEEQDERRPGLANAK